MRRITRTLFLVALLAQAACGSRHGADPAPHSPQAPVPALGDEAQNGGGRAEKTVIFAYLNMRVFVGRCLASGSCPLDDPERAVLARIWDAMKKVDPEAENIVFVSGKKHPGFFLIDGEVKSARTGNRFGDKIYVNTDHLYSLAPEGGREPIDLPSAAGLILDELAHQVGYDQKHEKLEWVGARLEKMLRMRSMRATTGRHLWATLLMSPYYPPSWLENIVLPGQLVIEDDESVYDLTSRLSGFVASLCEKKVWRGEHYRLSWYRLDNLQFSWKRSLFSVEGTGKDGPGKRYEELHLLARVACTHPQEDEFDVDDRYELVVGIQVVDPPFHSDVTRFPTIDIQATRFKALD